jgi:hypothetical protein
MKPFATSAFAAAIIIPSSFVMIGEGAARAQGAANRPPLANPAPANDGIAKLQEKQRDSAAPRPTENSSGIRARRKPDAAATTPDTSYHTIINSPPSSANKPDVSGPAETFAPNAPSKSHTVGGAQPRPVAPGVTGKTTLPESMQIQQETERALPPRRDLITKGGSSGAPAAPDVVNSSIERNRLDSAAPSRQRLQIDDLSAVRAQQQTPNAGAASPSNPVANGLPSINGASAAMSGSGVSAAPVGSGTVGRSPVISSARSAAAPAAASHSSAGSASSGGGH